MQRFHRELNTPSPVTDAVCARSLKRCANGADSTSNEKGIAERRFKRGNDDHLRNSRPARPPLQLSCVPGFLSESFCTEIVRDSSTPLGMTKRRGDEKKMPDVDLTIASGILVDSKD